MSQNTPPTPPLARTAKAKSTAEKVSKLRKLTDEQIAEEASLMADAAQSGSFPNKKISVAAWGNQRNLSQYMVERAFIRSLLQKQDYELDYGVANSAAGKRPYVDPRGMLMLPKSLIAAFNETAPADKQLTIGQPVDATFEDGKLILTPGI
ncbi:MAG: hypothetical protein AAGU21_15525 [Solidesulfovibrio sp.]|uniref:hypothetical protein n=1 Tax=Solidesulfovibrio sp. TaxID=2910990 RepID=UPI003158C548